jgi:hypothetical protein
MRQRRISRIITSITDKDGVNQTTTRGIPHTFAEFLKNKYDAILVEYDFIAHMENAGLSSLSTDWTNLLDALITEEGLKTAVLQGDSKKFREVMESAWNSPKLIGKAYRVT